jgi:hypothetical protein
MLQNPARFATTDIRIGAQSADIFMEISQLDHPTVQVAINSVNPRPMSSLLFHWNLNRAGNSSGTWKYKAPGGQEIGLGTLGIFPSTEPHNFIYPYLSSRKVHEFLEAVDLNRAISVTGNLQNLYAKVDRLANSQYRFHNEYRAACNSILGFDIFTNPSGGGKKAGLDVDGFSTIDLPAMGDGIANILGLIADLSVATGRLFIIEEPENDIHPGALRRLLDEIIKKSSTNQFIISTHSNVVVRHLGARAEANIFSIAQTIKDRVPESSAAPIV